MRLPFRAELIPPIAYFEMRQAGGLTDNWLKHRPYSKQSIDGCGTNFQTRKIRENSGGGAVWLARLLGVQEAGSSNLLPPTKFDFVNFWQIKKDFLNLFAPNIFHHKFFYNKGLNQRAF